MKHTPESQALFEKKYCPKVNRAKARLIVISALGKSKKIKTSLENISEDLDKSIELLTDLCIDCIEPTHINSLIAKHTDYFTGEENDKINSLISFLFSLRDAGLFSVTATQAMERGEPTGFNHIYIKSKIRFPNIEGILQLSKSPLPLIIEPDILEGNDSSSYLHHDLSVMSKKVTGLQRKVEMCLDNLNRLNQIPYNLDVDFLKLVDDQKDFDELTARYINGKYSSKKERERKRDTAWNKFNKEIKLAAIELINAGNKFYFDHFYDSRKRQYCRGHALNYQGKPWQKAMLNFDNETPCEIEPEYKHYFL